MVEICAIASGSNGNCYYIGNENEAVLIDAGISHRQFLIRMEEKQLDVSKVKAIFISHEHIDHVRGARVIFKKLNIPIYFTKKTLENTHDNSKPLEYNFFESDMPILIGEIEVHPFTKNHDAIEPCSFRVINNNVHVGVLTDIGKPCQNVIAHVKQCDALFIEANYDEKMLWHGAYPAYLKKRVASDDGHLSNEQACKLVADHSNGKLKYIFLSHLSAQNNTRELALCAFEQLSKKCDVRVTYRDGVSDAVRIE